MATNKTIKSFEISANIPNESFHVFLNVIHFEDKKRIITDGRFLAAVGTEYPEALENVNMRKDFTIEEGNFPNWRRVVPSVDDVQAADKYQAVNKPNDDTFDSCVKSYKLNTTKKDRYVNICNDGELLGKVNTKYWDMVLEFAKAFSNAVLYVGAKEEDRKCWKMATDNDSSFLLVMPCWNAEDTDFVFDIKTKELKVN